MCVDSLRDGNRLYICICYIMFCIVVCNGRKLWISLIYNGIWIESGCEVVNLYWWGDVWGKWICVRIRNNGDWLNFFWFMLVIGYGIWENGKW